ncbi:MAG TPA: hypothetical protein VFO11_06550 [Candidatus Polarisedimenticolaceae bacterium]|nr:hypothetical protein [Candidatus Polarisedimenticolaceae bacterium]
MRRSLAQAGGSGEPGLAPGPVFHDEEMLVQAGLFDDSSRGRDLVYNWVRVRALRAEVDADARLRHGDRFPAPQPARLPVRPRVRRGGRSGAAPVSGVRAVRRDRPPVGE